MPKSVKKHIRREKSRIRREVFEPAKQKELIDKLYNEYKADTSTINKSGN